ncbi:MAG: glycosyltransferase family 2 protein [Bacteroidales bacterium]|nr:glycosyltransferase family 2 protein [Bacteroidales bacterium]MBN2820107.1 glycosyltransferase family 2 protein [Bacteroidales bacterium]
MDLSIIIPLLNEEESLPELVSWIKKVMEENAYSYEVILIDDGSFDNSWEVIKKLKYENEVVKGVKFRRNYGKSAALHIGFGIAQGDIVMTMDADLQDSPDEIPGFVKMIREEGYDLVSGWKKKRFDPVFTKNLPSKFYNWSARRITGIKLHDFNCGIKAYRKKVIKSVEIYGEMHRYIPVLAKWAGFKKIGEKVVIHHERKFGKTKFGMERFVRGPLDLLSVMFISKFSKRPMHLFGLLGSIMFLIGFVIAAYLGASKMLAVYKHMAAPLISSSPYFYIGLTSMILGTQLFVAGFLGELISRSASDRNKYLIDEEI